MKSRTLLVWTLVSISIFFAACEGKKFKTVTDDDLDAFWAYELSGAKGGALVEMHASGLISVGFEPYNGCGASGDSSNTSGGELAAFLYFGSWHWSKNCVFGVPTSVHFTMEGTNEFHGDSQLEENSGWASQKWELTGLDTSSHEYALNGTGLGIAAGTSHVKSREKYFNYNDSLKYVNVKIRKSDQAIIGGGGTAHIFGSIGRFSSNDFDRKASFVFNPDGTYTLTLDNGRVFTHPQF